MADLITDTDAKAWLSIPEYDLTDNLVIPTLTAAASQAVRTWCGRSFNIESAQVASARYFFPLAFDCCKIDDAYEVTAVATDNGDDGSWSTTWSASDYMLLPYGGVGPQGQTGWPYTEIRAVESREFPLAARPAVKVTAKWGWSALPSDVKLAALMLFGEFYKAKDGGYETFTADSGFAVIRRNAVVRDLLQPYRTQTAADGRFVVG